MKEALTYGDKMRRCSLQCRSTGLRLGQTFVR
jgi:hypothetical protein